MADDVKKVAEGVITLAVVFGLGAGALFYGLFHSPWTAIGGGIVSTFVAGGIILRALD